MAAKPTGTMQLLKYLQYVNQSAYGADFVPVMHAVSLDPVSEPPPPDPPPNPIPDPGPPPDPPPAPASELGYLAFKKGQANSSDQGHYAIVISLVHGWYYP